MKSNSKRKIFSTISAILALMLTMSSLFCGCKEKPAAPDNTTTSTTQASDVSTTENQNSSYIPNVTFSAEIAEVNGVIYATRKATKTSGGMFDMQEREASDDIPTCKTIPIETDENSIVASFCYYDKYVYYVVSGGGSDYGENTELYRCKPDWTGIEMIAKNGPRDFVIDSGYLYYGGETFDLPSLQKVNKEYPLYSIPDVNSDTIYIQIFEDMVFYDDYSGDVRKIYYYDGNTSNLIAENATLDGGYACGYLYFARGEENGNGGILYRYNMQTGKTEEVHKLEIIAGGEGPYFCW